MPTTLSDQALQQIKQRTREVAQHADELAGVIAQAGMEQQHDTYKDGRCARIQQLCQAIQAAAGVGPGREP